MSFIPANHDDAAPTNAGGAAQGGGLMAIVHGLLADLPRQPDTQNRRHAELRRELDAFAWRLVGRLDGVDSHDDAIRARDSAGQG